MNRYPHALRALLAFALLFFLGARAFAAIPIQHWTQAGGAKIYFVESPSLPMLDLRVDFDAGARRDPADKAGLAGITAGMTAKGVAAHGNEPALDENQLGEAWADLGADMEEGATSDRMSFSVRTLTEPDILAKSIALASRQLGEPSFPEDVWQRERQRIAAAVREANTRPGTIAGKAYAAAVYGSHPYGHEMTEETLARISVADMRQFYRSLEPCRAKVTIVGAVTRAQADQIAATLLSRLPAGPGRCDALPPVPEVQPLTAAAVKTIPFASAQAHVLMGQPGYKRSDPDYFPLLVGGFPLLIDSNRKLLDNVANIAWNDLPLDYLDTWTAKVQNVAAADVRAAFARKLQPDRMITVILGAQPAR